MEEDFKTVDTEEQKDTFSDAKYEEKKGPECCKDKKHEEKGTISIFVLGLLSVIATPSSVFLALVGFILGLIAVIKGHKIKREESVPGFATAGWIMGIIGMVMSGIALILGLCGVFSFVQLFTYPSYHFYRTFWF